MRLVPEGYFPMHYIMNFPICFLGKVRLLLTNKLQGRFGTRNRIFGTRVPNRVPTRKY